MLLSLTTFINFKALVEADHFDITVTNISAILTFIFLFIFPIFVSVFLEY
jgi:hypothetical protein